MIDYYHHHHHQFVIDLSINNDDDDDGIDNHLSINQIKSNQMFTFLFLASFFAVALVVVVVTGIT